jgi:hypothetical protein
MAPRHQAAKIAPAEPEEPELCPLTELPGEDSAVPVDLIKKIIVFRVRFDPETQRESHRAPCGEIGPRTTYMEFMQRFGGGIYDLMMRGESRVVTNRRIEIDAPARSERAGAAALGNPVFETASGLAGIPGLDPQTQFLFALMQQNTAQIREDSRVQSENMLRMFDSLAKRPEPQQQNPNLQLLTGMIETMRAEQQALRKALDDEHRNNVTLAIEKARRNATKDADSDAPGKIMAAKFADRFDDVLGLLATLISKGQVQVAAAPNGGTMVTVVPGAAELAAQAAAAAGSGGG